MFVVFGPPIGGVAIGVSFAVRDILNGGPASWAMLTSLPFTALAAYLFGGVPAFVTGMMAIGLSDRVRSDWRWLTAATAIGAVSSFVFCIFLSPGLALLLGLIGAVAAFGSGILALPVRPKAKASTPARS